MNLFYLLGTNNYLIDSNLDITSSPVYVNKTDGVNLYPNMFSFINFGSDGVDCQTLDISSFVLGSNITGGFKEYTDFVLVDNVCNFIGSKSYFGGNPSIIASRDVTNSSFNESLVLNTVTWTGITYGNGIYCIVGVSDTNEITIGTSGNKVTWNYVTLTTVDSTVNPKVTFGNNKFILVDNAIYSSNSGTSWSMVYNDTNTWNDIEYSNKGFIAYNGSNSCTSLDGVTWTLHILPNIIGSDVSLAYWKNIVSNGDILCMKSSPDIVDSTSGMSSITFSNDGGLSWMTQALLDGANQGIISLSVPKFWEQFIKTTES